MLFQGSAWVARGSRTVRTTCAWFRTALEQPVRSRWSVCARGVASTVGVLGAVMALPRPTSSRWHVHAVCVLGAVMALPRPTSSRWHVHAVCAGCRNGLAQAGEWRARGGQQVCVAWWVPWWLCPLAARARWVAGACCTAGVVGATTALPRPTRSNHSQMVHGLGAICIRWCKAACGMMALCAARSRTKSVSFDVARSAPTSCDE